MRLILLTILIPTAILAGESPTKYESNPNSGNFQIRAKNKPEEKYRPGSFSQPWREYHHDIGGHSRCKRDPDCKSTRELEPSHHKID